MEANEYEFLINTIYYNGTLQTQSMNAENYLKMQDEYRNLEVKKTAENHLEHEYAFRKAFLIVRNYVQQAMKDGLKSFQFCMKKQDIEKLSCLIAMLHRNFFDKSSLDQIIVTANSVFNQYNFKN